MDIKIKEKVGVLLETKLRGKKSIITPNTPHSEK
jgi:hypothetical protein